MASIKLKDGSTFTGTVAECREFMNAGKGDKSPIPKHEYVKANGEKIMATDKQIALWESKKAAYTPEERAAYKEQKAAEWEQTRSSFEPSENLKAFVKGNMLCTRKEAKEHGFVGTKEDLKALKASLR